jgi:hypothetical protein
MYILNLYLRIQYFYVNKLSILPLITLSCTILSLWCPCEASGICDLITSSSGLPADASNINYQPEPTSPMDPHLKNLNVESNNK